MKSLPLSEKLMCWVLGLSAIGYGILGIVQQQTILRMNISTYSYEGKGAIFAGLAKIFIGVLWCLVALRENPSFRVLNEERSSYKRIAYLLFAVFGFGFGLFIIHSSLPYPNALALRCVGFAFIGLAAACLIAILNSA